MSNASGLIIKVGTGKQREISGQEIWRKYSLKGQIMLSELGGDNFLFERVISRLMI